ncbi:Hypothetical protein ERS451418_03331 [Mycolicibacterium smegmatis]|nr:Hypothetical protein ERS451418_03331 [Mycolicibacterium smegmatis]
MSSRDASEGAGDRAPVSGIALLTLLALLFLGMVVLGIATGDVPIDNKALAFAPVFYSLTVMGGLVASFFGFTVLEAVLSRRGDPARGRERAALVILGLVSGVFFVTCLLALPVVALGVAANGLGVGIALLWRVRGGARVYWVLLWVAFALAVIAGAWTAVAIQGAIV